MVVEEVSELEEVAAVEAVTAGPATLAVTALMPMNMGTILRFLDAAGLTCGCSVWFVAGGCSGLTGGTVASGVVVVPGVVSSAAFIITSSVACSTWTRSSIATVFTAVDVSVQTAPNSSSSKHTIEQNPSDEEIMSDVPL